MSKIVKAINAMISNPDKITSSVKGYSDTECFFKYDKKHHWSIYKTNDSYILNYYPSQPDLNSLASIPDEYWDEHAPNSVTYNTKDLATKEAVDSFRELFSIVNEKLHGMDDVLNEIIGSDIPF
jgi:hypothetical protein